MLDSINEVYKKGLFRWYGLSNFSAEQMQEAYDVAKSKGFMVPTVYQRKYNPIARHLETIPFSTLRNLASLSMHTHQLLTVS
jgi:aflatoxin B1 aldehyde reductase